MGALSVQLKQKITPFLWFDGKAEEAANFHLQEFNDSRRHSLWRDWAGQKGSVMSTTFEHNSN
jgi:predicted 3-demethylubiquinone-9 3-methyltransferase (glyoxalase superfamily)